MFGVGLAGIQKFLNFLLSPVRFTKCSGVRVPLLPPRKKALIYTSQCVLLNNIFLPNFTLS
jgi:hypothetical protein